MTSEERRQYPRVELVAQAEVMSSEVARLLRVVNLSQGGVFLQGTPANYPDFQVGVTLAIHVMAPEVSGDEGEDGEDEGTDLRADGTIVRVQGGGFAIEFGDLSDDQERNLSVLLRASS